VPGEFKNIYQDVRYADAYARLEFPGTYYLAFRDLPGVFARHLPVGPAPAARGRAKGKRRALDFGCGAGRSTRFLARCGFEPVGVDISEDMVALARQADAAGDYRAIADGDFSALAAASFDLVFAAFPFDNVPGRERKVRLLAGLRALLAAGGRLVNLVSSPEIYVHEWVSFTTRDFPENRRARSGDVVRIINLAVEGRTPVEDILCTEEAWRDAYAAAGLEVLDVLRPLAAPGETGVAWVSETAVAPWTVYVLGPVSGQRRVTPG